MPRPSIALTETLTGRPEAMPSQPTQILLIHFRLTA
jgi:hypothetical protein